jgi:hypothetical protein
MGETRPSPARRLGAERRAASAVMTNYIRERSKRRSDGERSVSGMRLARRATPRAAAGCWDAAPAS